MCPCFQHTMVNFPGKPGWWYGDMVVLTIPTFGSTLDSEGRSNSWHGFAAFFFPTNLANIGFKLMSSVCWTTSHTYCIIYIYIT